MKIHSFIADSAPEAVAQIRAQLGSEAVVLNVRKVERDGLEKLWKKARIEVLAHLPEAPPRAEDPLIALGELRREIADLKRERPVRQEVPVSEPVSGRIDYGGWRAGALLEQAGILPRNVQRILDEMREEAGSNPPESLGKEIDLARAAIIKLGRFAAGSLLAGNSGGVHVLVGPPGAGKTTVLSKLLAQRVLVDGWPARVLRLDGARANMAESLSVYGEILGVTVDRCLTPQTEPTPGETVLVDLPGVAAADHDGIGALAAQVAALPGARTHLVLNAAYETSTLLSQARAFGNLPVEDVIFTHLDEEQRWGKLLNFAWGTKCPPALLSAGQNVPGELHLATAEKILSRVTPSK